MNPVKVDEVFRTEWAPLVAVLVRDLGDLDLAEEAAQEAFVEAAQRWSTQTMPDRPGAWLLTTARRKAIDRIRRTKRLEERLPHLMAAARSVSSRPSTGLIDEQLGLILGCCHSALNTEAQLALTLRLVAGLSTAQIARAFLVEEATMSKRITRAKTKIKNANIPLVVPDRSVLAERLDQVHNVVYLIFTEGHASATDEVFVRGDLCDEALWLSGLLVELVPEDAETLGLAALIRLTDARRATRVGDDGVPIMLDAQDRTRWDRAQIAEGLALLVRAAGETGFGPLRLQAAIAAVHATAPTFDATDWKTILRLYDQLVALGPSPVRRLNRAVALSYAEGPEASLAAMADLDDELQRFHYFHSARAELLRRIGHNTDAGAAYLAALDCEPSHAERLYLERRLASLGSD